MKKKAIFLYTSVLSVIAFAPMIVFGQGVTNPIKSRNLQELLAAILDIVVQLGTPLIILGFIYAGFLFVRAQGNPEKISEARRAFTYTAIGAAVLLGATVLSTLISNTVTELL